MKVRQHQPRNENMDCMLFPLLRPLHPVNFAGLGPILRILFLALQEEIQKIFISIYLGRACFLPFFSASCFFPVSPCSARFCLHIPCTSCILSGIRTSTSIRGTRSALKELASCEAANHKIYIRCMFLEYTWLLITYSLQRSKFK